MRNGPCLCGAWRRGRRKSQLFLDRLVGLGVGGVVGGLVGVVGDALHAFLEATQPLAESLAEFGQLLATEENENDDRQNDEMCRCKEFAHDISLAAGTPGTCRAALLTIVKAGSRE